MDDVEKVPIILAFNEAVVLGLENSIEAAFRIEAQNGQEPGETQSEIRKVKENVFIARRRKRVLEARNQTVKKTPCKCSFAPCYHTNPLVDKNNDVSITDHSNLPKRLGLSSNNSALCSSSTYTNSNFSQTSCLGTDFLSVNVKMHSSKSFSPSPFSNPRARLCISRQSD